MATFPEIMYSQPSVYQGTTLATLLSSAKTLASGWALYRSVSDLKQSWGGSTQLTQARQATSLASSGQQVLTSLTQTQTQINSAATQIQAAKTKLTALCAAARAEGFVVLPTGQVILGPAQLSTISVHPGMAAYYKARAAVYNGQIQAVVATTTATDLQNGLALAKTGVDILNAIMNRNGAAPAPAVTGVDPTTLTAANIGAAGTTPDQIGVGTGLAGVGGVGDLRGITGDGGLGGLGGIPLPGGGLGPGGVGAGGAPGLGGFVSGPGLNPGATAPGLAGVGAGGPTASGEPVAGRMSATPASGTSVIGMGGAGRGGPMSDEEREARGWLLAEDEDAWTPANVADATGGVLS